MKTLFALFFTLATLALFAQDTTNLSSMMKETSQKLKEKNTSSRDRIVVDIFFDNWLHNEDSLQTKWYSRGFNAYFMYDILLGKKALFSVAPGLGVGTNNVFHNSALSVDTNGTELVKRTDDYKRNKIGLAYVDIPVELRFRSKPNAKNKSFKVALGFKAGILIDSKTKVRKEDAFGEMKVYKEKRLDNLNLFRYGATFRVGYGPFNLFAFYSLSKLFEKDRGPEITPFSVGFSINGL